MGAKDAGGRPLRRAWFYAFSLWMMAGLVWPAAAAGQGATGGVRALQARGKALVAMGIRRSTTFKGLIENLVQSDVVVYVDLNPYDGRKFDGALEFVGSGGGARFVRVWVRPNRTDNEVLATLGHELQHALEVARAREVMSQASLAAFYARAGWSDNAGQFETAAAQQVAARVRAEISQAR